MKKYTKAVVQVVITVLVALAAVWTGGVTNPELVNVAIVGVGALGVFAAPNVPGAAYTKSVLAALSAGLVVLASAITGGIVFPEVVQIIVAAVGALGVYALPNRGAELGVVR
jgi:hypothetical protein